MFQQNGLSLDQAPPVSVVFRFFFSASLFGILSGVLILFYQSKIFQTSSAAAITLTHTLTLGVMASFMLGALFQMLPVIAGVVIQSPAKKSWWIQIPFVLGTIALLLAFNLPQYHHLYWLASFLLGSSLLGVTALMLKNLSAITYHTPSSKGMILALLSFAFVVILALYLTFTLSGLAEGSYYASIKTAHYSFGLFGWITLLIISISFQVIEMFYVTPPYPLPVSRYLTTAIFLLLLVKVPLALFMPNVILAVDTLIALLFIGFAILTLYRLSQRKRPLADATIWFWRMGMGSLITSMFFWLLYGFFSMEFAEGISTIAFASFGLSVVFAMFYKIIPFLTWFHLNAQGYFTAPMMHEVIHPKTAKKHFWIHFVLMITLIGSLFIEKLLILSGLLTILSFGWVSYQIVHAHLLYIKTQKTGEKFEMGG
ncbi:MAG: hypothetical protein U9Q90_10440 [Campylobacterota bacterium]|nr:hypothetical protein [Campylobacterota bacterium]